MKKRSYEPKGAGGDEAPPEKPETAPPVPTRHPLVAQTAKAFRHATTDDRKGILAGLRGEHLDLRVSRELLDRSLRFMDRLLRALDATGMETDLTAGGRFRNAVAVSGEHVRFYLMERLQQVPYVPTPEERATMRRHPNLHLVPRWGWRPIGKLAFRLAQDYGFEGVVRTRWEDGPDGKIEAMIDSIVRGFRKAGASRKLHRERVAQVQMEMAEAERRRARAEAARRAEEHELEALEEEAGRWFRARRLREYVDAVEEAANRDGGYEADSELDRWLRKAREAADRLDPLVEDPQPPPEK